MSTSRVTIDSKARELLDEMAQSEGVTTRQYLEALVHHAGSRYYRPGSWEATSEFNYDNYDNKSESDVADRWF